MPEIHDSRGWICPTFAVHACDHCVFKGASHCIPKHCREPTSQQLLHVAFQERREQSIKGGIVDSRIWNSKGEQIEIMLSAAAEVVI